MDATKVIPSMFLRRLLLLMSLAGVVVIGLSGQLFRLAVVQGAQRRNTAERSLNVDTYLPTVRGSILDRRGRILAADRPCYDVAVKYRVITGAWAVDQARTEARKKYREQWAQLDSEQQHNLVDEILPQYQQRIEELWQTICTTGDIDEFELHRRCDEIKRQIQSQADVVWEHQRRREERDHGVEAMRQFKPRPILEQTIAHVILHCVTDETAHEFQRLAALHPDMLEVLDGQRRTSPWSIADVPLERATFPWPIRSSTAINVRVDGVADHILGNVRDQVYESEIKRLPFRDPETEVVNLKGYRLGDSVGSRGLEAAAEDYLRGTRGLERLQLDSGDTKRVERQFGNDIQTTIDIGLQARVQAILTPEVGLTQVQQWQIGWHGDGTPKPAKLPLGTPLNAAAVVLEVNTGEILAMVSMPTLAIGRDHDAAWREQNVVWVNRPVEGIYPPGSIIKPLVLAAAVSSGSYDFASPIECTGHFFDDRKDIARCWIYREQWGFATHGALTAEEALARSCNMFFYTLAQRTGMQQLVKWYSRFGLGELLDVGLRYNSPTSDAPNRMLGELSGSLPRQETIDKLKTSGELKFQTIILGIGQGPITWTPMQAVNAYAILARNGVIRDPTILFDNPQDADRRTGNLDLDLVLVRKILEGLRQSVMETYGTGHHMRYPGRPAEPIINAKGVTVWAKTGTAQAPALTGRDMNDDGLVDKNDVIVGLDHAWFVGLVGEGDGKTGQPEYAIAVLVEYGGSGGRTAGPIANQIIHALQTEGYLPKPSIARGEEQP